MISILIVLKICINFNVCSLEILFRIFPIFKSENFEKEMYSFVEQTLF